jgi:hypothetical protein
MTRRVEAVSRLDEVLRRSVGARGAGSLRWQSAYCRLRPLQQE